VYAFDEFELNLDLRVLVRKGKRVAVGPKAYDVLTCLVANTGRVVSKNELLKAVWAESYVEESTLTQHVFSLRKALGDKAEIVVTVPGSGYRLDAVVRHILTAVEPAFGHSGQGAGQQIVHELMERTHVVIEEPMPALPRSGPRHAGLYALVACGLLAVAAVGAWWWSKRAAPRDHVAIVLGEFANNTGNSVFDQMLGRALAIDLSQSPFLDVLSERESADTLGLMGKKPDTPLTPAIAREVCERANQQVALNGSIAALGSEYLMTLEAVDCHTGKTLASAKERVAGNGKVLDGLDSLAERVRSKLGESAQSIGKFDVPLQQTTTSSLEALRIYSIGKHVQAQANGDSEAIPLFQRAIQIDPLFATAYGELAVSYYNLSEPQMEAEYMKKAYDLRYRVSAQDRLTFEAHYLDSVLGDTPAALKVYKEWTETYPRDWVPWMDAANLDQQLGRYEQAIPYARQALVLSPSVICYDVLVRAVKSAGRFAEAKALIEQAVRDGKDSGTLHSMGLEIAEDEHDAGAFARESQAMAKFKDGYRSYFLGKAASMEGKYILAEFLFHEEIAADKQQGLGELADSVAVDEATAEREMGMREAALRTLNGVGATEKATGEYALERARFGDVAFCEQFLAAHRNDQQRGTDLQYVQLPTIRAMLALAHKKPLEAVDVLSVPSPYGLDPTSILMLRGEAYLQAGKFEQAAAQYKVIVDNPGHGFDVEHPLALLGLARAFAGAGDVAGARMEYEAFLAAWKNGDPDVPVLKAAKAELARLR
jgi:DNA-binding winged helix-turn-helix (wHTH) protein/tetratricopeptide (TPR) repeat protein